MVSPASSDARATAAALAIFDLDDAMKVKTYQGRITAIGKALTSYDSIDTGIFVCPLEIFRYLVRARLDGDCGLADGVRLMATDNKVRAVDIGDAWWKDVDDNGMLGQAQEAAARLTLDLRAEVGAGE